MTDSSINAYQQHVKSTETTQETEAAVLERAAYILVSAQREPDNDEIFHDALKYNQLVWTSIQSVLNNENQLPDQIVANLMSLSIFIDRQISKALYEENRDLLTAIININRNIAAGLRDAVKNAPRNSENTPPSPPPSGLPPIDT